MNTYHHRLLKKSYEKWLKDMKKRSLLSEEDWKEIMCEEVSE